MSKLSSKFSDLESFVDAWALPTENSRSVKRWASGPSDFQPFYEAMMPRLDEIFTYLDQFELGQMPDDAHTLYLLSLAFAEASPHVEMYKGNAEVPNSFDAERFVATHGDIRN